MVGRLASKVAIITGAASGIGAASARRFAAEGALLALADVDRGGLERVAAEIESSGGRAIAVPTDVTKAPQVEALVQRTIDEFGRLDVMFANAGINNRGTVVDMPEEIFDQILDVNLRGCFLCAKYAIPRLAERGGSLIFTSSELALVGSPGNAVYSGSKAALIGMARGIAMDHSREGIRVNCICPGPVDTPLRQRSVNRQPDPAAYEANLLSRMPFGRIGEPDEIASAAVFLASDESVFMTGTFIVVDGGITAR